MDANEANRQPDGTYKFSDLIAPSEVNARWEKVRKYFFLRESTYDMSNRCNIRCNGCYYHASKCWHLWISLL